MYLLPILSGVVSVPVNLSRWLTAGRCCSLSTLYLEVNVRPVSILALVALCVAVAGCASSPRFEAYPGARSSSYPSPSQNTTPGQPWHSEGDLYPRIVFPFCAAPDSGLSPAAMKLRLF